MTDKSGGLIDPAKFVAKSAELHVDVVTGSASNVRAMGAAVGDKTESIASSWEGLRPHYQAPEQEQVYGLMVPAADAGRELRAVFEAMAGHLEGYSQLIL